MENNVRKKVTVMKYYCNPVNINYRYQFNADQRKNKISICREAADGAGP